MSDSLLPPNASQLERAVEAATLRIDAIPVPLRALWNPQTIPAPLLSWLAWGLSVDVWDPAWTEPRKRAVVARSIDVHRHKGTVGAMLTALSALDYNARLVEWHKTSPRGAPYTFAIEAMLDARGIADGIWDDIERVALAAKNARSHLTSIRLVHTSPSPAVFAGAMIVRETITLQPYSVTELDSQGSAHIGAASWSRETVTLTPMVH